MLIHALAATLAVKQRFMQSQVNDILLGQSVKFPRANPRIAVSNKTFHSVTKHVWKVPQIVNRTAIKKCLIINMILFITEFALLFQ